MEEVMGSTQSVSWELPWNKRRRGKTGTESDGLPQNSSIFLPASLWCTGDKFWTRRSGDSISSTNTLATAQGRKSQIKRNHSLVSLLCFHIQGVAPAT